MKIVLSSSRHHYMARVSVFLITVALIVGMVGCGPFLLQYNLTMSSTKGGEVTTPGEGTFTYSYGTGVNLVAEAEEGYYFVNWTGDIGTISCQCRSTTITMQGDYEITANFAFATEVWDWNDLDAIRDNPGGNYILMNDLDSTTAGYAELAGPTANGGKGWQPIGALNATFIGTLDGQGYEIKDLSINRPDEEGVGLFGSVGEVGVVENLGVANAFVTGYTWVGGLAGMVDYGVLAESFFTGSLYGNSYVGGLAGWNGGTVSNSYSTGSVAGGSYVGGLVGYAAEDGNVSSNHFTGSVAGNYSVGGLVGWNGGTVSNSYTTGSVAGNYSVGGLVGWNGGTVDSSYARTTVDGNLLSQDSGGAIGGSVGWNEGGTVINCYATGMVTGGNETVGGLVGRNEEGTVRNSFWDTETSRQATSDGGTGKTTAEMKDIDTFSRATWNITAVANPGTRNPSYIWNIVDDVTYPFLSWQTVS